VFCHWVTFSLRIFPQCRTLPAIMLNRLSCLVFFLLTASSAWASLAPEADAYAYDKAGQLTRITDSKGERNYRYDPVGRLTESLSPLGREKFAFDPANNLVDTNQRDIQREESGLALETEKHTTGKLLDNLLKDYAGTHYRHDERGNLVEKIRNGERIRYQWNASNQLVKVETADTVTQFRYDPLGRRIIKHSAPVVPRYFDAGRQYRTVEAQRLSREKNLGTTFYGWDGDTLAWETTNEESTHYFYEPDSFVPLAQGVQNHAIQLHPTPDWTDRDYSLKEDPLWTQVLQPEPFDKLGFYHCDHLGTPQEITDEEGNIAWQAQYKAWGEAKEIIGKTATKAGFRNPLRFQGQYFDHETGLHYNRFRYYDPETGRFISKDPIGLHGGLNEFTYALNSTEWIDPSGLKRLKQGQVYETHSTRTKVSNVNGRMPRNSCYAGKVMPMSDVSDNIKNNYSGIIGRYPHGVPFNIQGFPDFSRYAKTTVDIGSFSSNEKGDFAKADAIARSNGIAVDRDKWVWHHNQQNGKLQLVPRDIHEAVSHTGGASICGIR
jgi:RHS repeat-associated protein